MAHDGSEGLSPDGWLPDRISVGVLTRVFTPELVDAAVEGAGARERRLLPARLVVYFVLAQVVMPCGSTGTTTASDSLPATVHFPAPHRL